jgi:L-asparaginase
MAQARIYVLYTGGTFGMAPDVTRAGAPLAPRGLSELEPALAAPAALAGKLEVTVAACEPPLDSSSMGPADWRAIAERIAAQYDTFDGFVIIHGTDTLTYTASALSFMFENLAKPIVLTGSQVPLDLPGSDAGTNYLAALATAGSAATGGLQLAEVVIVFGGRVLRGNRARKVSATSLQAFDTPNYAHLGKALPDGNVSIDVGMTLARPSEGNILRCRTTLETGVADLTIHPGLRPEQLHAMLTLDGVRGVVLRTYGSGNAPEAPAFLDALSDGLADGGKVCVAVTQCLHGGVAPGQYAAAAGLAMAGVIPGCDMTPEAALAKLMFVLGQTDGDAARAMMQENLRGELTVPRGPAAGR